MHQEGCYMPHIGGSWSPSFSGKCCGPLKKPYINVMGIEIEMNVIISDAKHFVNTKRLL